MSEEGDSGARSRRRTTKVVNYSKEQDFSDDDVFEDDDDKEDTRAPVRLTSTKKRGRPRKAMDSATETEIEDDDFGPIKPLFTEKGYDATLPPIRERFPFLPEVEADGSPRIELIVGRRPIGYVPHVDENIDDDEGEERKRRIAKKKPSPSKKDFHGDLTEYEYLIKFKGVSYLHLEWKTGGDLESMNRSAKTLYRRYLKKLALGTDEDLENPEIDPSFVLPQKVVDEADQEVSMELTDKELVDWVKENKDDGESDEGDVKFEKMDDDEIEADGEKIIDSEMGNENGTTFLSLVFFL